MSARGTVTHVQPSHAHMDRLARKPRWLIRHPPLNNLESTMPMPVLPIPTDGPCPSGYFRQNNLCVPTASAKPAIAKNGPCPSGWHMEGNYCVANTHHPKVVIPKNGPCPSGYHAEGNYCVQN